MEYIMKELESMNYMEMVRQDGMALQYVKEQTPEICMEAVKQNGWALEYVEEQTPEICMEAVKQNGLVLQYVKEQTPEICMEAVKQNEWALTYVKEQTSEIYLEVVKHDGMALQYVKEQTPEICMEAVKQNGWALEYVKEQTPEICLEAVKQDGLALSDVKEQTPEICLEAVKQDGLVVQFVEEQTPEICLEAVKQNGLALEYVKEQTSKVCMEAVKQSGLALLYVKEQTPEVCMEAVKQNGWALQYVKEQTSEICREAVRQDRGTLEYVQPQFRDVVSKSVNQRDTAIEEIMKKLDAFAETADDYMFADEEFQERLYRTLQEYKKMLQDNPGGIVTLQPKFYEQSNPNELDVSPDLWNEFWNYLERYGVTGDERFSNRRNNIAAQPETKEQAFSIMKDIKEYLDNRLYMTSYMRGDVAVNEDIASYYMENAYRYLNEKFDNPDRNQEMENQIKAAQEVFSLDEAAIGRFYTTNLGGTGWGKGEKPYFYVTEDLQSSFDAAYASYLASDADGRTIGYSNAGMSASHIVMLAGCYYDEGKEVHVLNKYLENQVFDKDSKVLADIEKKLYKELKQRNAEEAVEIQITKYGQTLIEETIQKVNVVKEAFVKDTGENLSDWDIGRMSDNQMKAMLILGQTQAIEFALNELGEAALKSGVDTQRLETLDVVRNTRDEIQKIIETGADIDLYKEKVSLLMSGQFLNSQESVSDWLVSSDYFGDFSNCFREVVGTYSIMEGLSERDQEGLGADISFFVEDIDIYLCDIMKVDPSHYNLSENYYIGTDNQHERTIAFTASEIKGVDINYARTSSHKYTEQMNPDYKTVSSDFQKLTSLTKDEVVEAVYRYHVVGDGLTYNVLFSVDPSKEPAEQSRFYVEDIDGKAIASGKSTISLSEATAIKVLNQIGIYEKGIDSVTYRLRNPLEEYLIHDRSQNQDISNIPYMVEVIYENTAYKQQTTEVFYCVNKSIASNIVNHVMETEKNVISADIKTRVPSLKEYERNMGKEREKLIEEQKKIEQCQKEDLRVEEKRRQEKEQDKEPKEGKVEKTMFEISLLQEMANLKAELSRVKTEISGLRKEIGSKERNVKTLSKKDTKKKSGR